MSLSKYIIIMAIVFFIMMIGMMIAINKTDQLKRDKLKVIELNDSLNLKVYSNRVYNGVYEINHIYNLKGPYFKTRSKYTYTGFANSNLDSIIKKNNSNMFIFIYKDEHRDSVFLKKETDRKGYFSWD